MGSRLSIAALGGAIVGLGASIASLTDYLGAAPTFCAETGCDAVRESAWAHPLGIPMPVLGVGFYLAAAALAFVDAPRLRRVLAVAGAASAVLLIGVQGFVIGAWCKLCLVADAAALGYAIAVLAGATRLRFTVPRLLVTAPAVLAAVGLLALWTHREHAPDPIPLPVATTGDDTPWFVKEAQVRGAATVVEVVDFECPFCRRMQEQLTAAVAKARHPVRLVRKMVPLPIHPHAMPAAIAYCCADAQGKGEEMAAALFAADPDELSPEGCEQLALKIGCDLQRYRDDMRRAAARVASETEDAKTAGIRSLPTLFIGRERVVGASKSAEELTAMLDALAID